MEENADAACELLRSLAHPVRLMILCMLASRPRTVSEICTLLPSTRQSVVSQHLARLRHEHIVHAERDGNHVRYSLLDSATREIIAALHGEFC